MVNMLLTEKFCEVLVGLRNMRLSTHAGRLCLHYHGWDPHLATANVRMLIEMSRCAVESSLGLSRPINSLNVRSVAEARDVGNTNVVQQLVRQGRRINIILFIAAVAFALLGVIYLTIVRQPN